MATTASKVTRNTLAMISGYAISVLLSFVTTVLLVRFFGAEDFGMYSFVFAYLSFFVILTTLGIDMIVVREISKEKSRADVLIGNSVIMKLMLSSFAFLLASAVMMFLRYPLTMKLLVFTGALSLLFSFSSSYDAIFQVNLKMEYVTIANVLTEAIKLAAFVFLIHLKAHLASFVAAVVLAAAVKSLLVMRFSGRYVRPRFDIDLGCWKELLKASLPLALTSVFITVYARIDQIMLFGMKGKEALGYYSSSVRIAEMFSIIPLAFMTSVFPLMSYSFKTSPEYLRRLYSLSFKYMLTVVLFMSVVVTLFSREILAFAYGGDFAAAGRTLMILMWAEVFVFFGVVHNRILISVNKQNRDFILTLGSALINVLANLLLIPAYGIEGAAVASLIAYASGLGIALVIPDIRAYALSGWISLLKPLLAAVVTGSYMYFTRPVSPALSLLGSPLVFVAILVLVKGLGNEDVRLISRIWPGAGGVKHEA